jgi:hypothetical protein
MPPSSIPAYIEQATKPAIRLSLCLGEPVRARARACVRRAARLRQPMRSTRALSGATHGSTTSTCRPHPRQSGAKPHPVLGPGWGRAPPRPRAAPAYAHRASARRRKRAAPRPTVARGAVAARGQSELGRKRTKKRRPVQQETIRGARPARRPQSAARHHGCTAELSRAASSAVCLSPPRARLARRREDARAVAGQGLVTMSAMLVKVFSRMRPCTFSGNLINRTHAPTR